jgi:8-oxo-dGTP pyrophosphatase MutT (NUDIX family)
MSLLHVGSIDFKSSRLSRASIIPYMEVNHVKIFAFGISYNCKLCSIGGQWDRNDFDLLDTATREFGEEVGYKVDIEKVFYSKGIVTQGNIAILLKFEEEPVFVVPSKEIEAVVWLTVDQLSRLHKMEVSKFAKMSLTFDVIHSLPFLHAFDEEEYTPFRSVPIRNIKKVKKFPEWHGVDAFEHHLEHDGCWQLVIAVFHEDKVYLKKNDDKVYIVPLKKFILATHRFKDLKTRISVFGSEEVPSSFTYPCGSIIKKLKNDGNDQTSDILFRLYSEDMTPLKRLSVVCELEEALYTIYKSKQKQGNQSKISFVLEFVKLINSRAFNKPEDVGEDVLVWALEYSFIE